METKNSAASRGGWYFTLLDKVQELARKFDLPEDIVAEVQNLVMDIARSQFKAGSKSGAAYVYKKQDETRMKNAGSPVAA